LTLLDVVSELEVIAQTAATPDGRWELLQAWIKKNPSWEKKINAWLKMTPDKACAEFTDYLAKQAERQGLPSHLFLAMAKDRIERRVMPTIDILQTCYRERKRETIKEPSQ